MALAPKPLHLSSISQFPTPHPFQNPNLKFVLPKLHSQKPPTLSVCKSTQTDTPDFPVSTPDTDGSGPSAPTRGELFLQRYQSSAASSTVLEEIKKKKKNKEKVVKSTSFNAPSCYGCGAPLQTSELDAPGYVEPETYSLVIDSMLYYQQCLRLIYIVEVFIWVCRRRNINSWGRCCVVGASFCRMAIWLLLLVEMEGILVENNLLLQKSFAKSCLICGMRKPLLWNW